MLHSTTQGVHDALPNRFACIVRCRKARHLQGRRPCDRGASIRATPKGAQVAGGYMKITNTGKEADRLVGGTLDQTRRLEIHQMTMVGDVMQMRPLPDGLVIKPGETVELEPGGYHVMGLDLQAPFASGQTAKGTLQFEKAGTIQIEYAVVPVGGSPQPEPQH
jgi:periplasmic copper chaperone A